MMEYLAMPQQENQTKKESAGQSEGNNSTKVDDGEKSFVQKLADLFN